MNLVSSCGEALQLCKFGEWADVADLVLLDVQLFQPGSETYHYFYAERPISVHMLGDYHQFGEFVSGVASLPRVVILTMHDINLRRANIRDIRGGDGRLFLEGTVKTYRYIDEDEAAELAEVDEP